VKFVLVAVLAATLAVGCTPSVIADWTVDPAYSVTPETTALHLIVQQKEGGLGDGTTAERVLRPDISYGADAFATTIRISTLANGILLDPHLPLVVLLNQPVGSRAIPYGAAGAGWLRPSPRPLRELNV